MDRRTGPNQFATYQPTIFFRKESKFKERKKIIFFFCVCVGGGGNWDGWRGRWMDRRTSPNQFAPSTSSKLT